MTNSYAQSKELHDKLISMSMDEADGLLTKLKIKHRINSIDGEHFALTMDIESDRINVDIKDNKVTRVFNG